MLNFKSEIEKYKFQMNGVMTNFAHFNTGKRKEERICPGNERCELVARGTNDVVWDWDLTANRMCRSINYVSVYGHETVEENANLEAWLLNIHEDDRQRVYESVLSHLQNIDFSTWEEEYRYMKANGEIAYVKDKAYVIYSKNNTPLRMVGVMSDVTIDKVAELEKDRTTAELIQRNKDLEQFAYIVSHNLRSPVASILGLSALWNNSAISPHDKEYISKGVLASVQKLDEVIKDLNYILQSKNQMNEKKEKVLFSELVKDIQVSIHEIIAAENVKIKTDFRAVSDMTAFRSYLYSIFYNLISNSIKYKRKDVETRILIRSRVEANKTVLSFRDNGIGIDLEKNGDKVFGLYKRFCDEKEGKGMGLFMVKTQVESLGGKISIKSELDKGTEFRIEF
jgi:signal transduction histidine kinase